ncbi:TetR/AcrR family transcriptional regulator [Anaerosoma tenue]|uniref:TetR/AcrR family transcriptional regulator n=1 Tax=Anaerosoma tenue TaxID=2933588 RepID=UPI002260F261|nr:TetR/AcrR family transcriptional regulator [Anaerosoma tenue]MCK8115507.1 TetR/AcrR family transcriptional regulator [Anaerosoma tenue]
MAPDGLSARERILGTAGELFADRGYNGVSIADIAAASGISTGLVYYHFKDKESLYESVVRAGLHLLEETAVGTLGVEGHPTDRLQSFIHSYMTLLEGHPALMRLLIRSVTDVSSPAPGQVLTRSAVTIDRLQSVIEEGVTSGEFRPVDTHLAATALFALVNTLITARVLDTPLGQTGGASIEERARSMTGLFLEGIRAC